MGTAGASADNAQRASRNAVCITLKSGDAKYVAFTDEPVISTAGGKLTVVSAADNKSLALADIADVEKITAVYYDFSTGVAKVTVGDTTTEQVFNLDGTRATTIVPGRVYIIRTGNVTRKVVK